MTTDPALANLYRRADRLAEIDGMFEQGHWDEDWARGDIKWLIAEVKRLRTNSDHAVVLLQQALREWHVRPAALLWVRGALDELGSPTDQHRQP